jgi:outer membrane protein
VGVSLKRILLLGLGLLLPAASQAEDLLGIYKTALERDPQFKGAKATYEATLEARPQAQSLLLPSLLFNADVSRHYQHISTSAQIVIPGRPAPSNNPDFTSGGYALRLTQPILNTDSYMQLRQAESRILQAGAELDAAQEELLLRVAERYFDMLAAEDNRSFAQAEKTALESQLKQAKERFDVGLIAITDVQEAQAGYDLAVAQEIEADNQLDNAREAMREVTGAYYQDWARLGEGMPLVEPEPADIKQWASRATEYNRRVTAARLSTDTAEKEIRRQSAGHLPTLDLVGEHGMSKTGGRFGDANIEDTSVGLVFNLPIYEGGRVNSKTREAQHLHEKALEQFEQARRGAQRQGSEAYLGVISGISRVKARRDYARARYDYILNSLRLKQAAGILAIEDVVKVNGWLKLSTAKNHE